MLRIIEIESEYVACNAEEIEAILRKPFDSGGNAFSCTHENEDFPMLSILVNAERATLNYLERGDEPGFVPTGNALSLDLKESTVFRVSRNPADDVEVANDAVVSFAFALQAATEFLASNELPKCVEWIEL